MSIALALVSHTNVGKTSLVRTLLRRDVGEVADRAHVTLEPERHVLVQAADGDTLDLWDTPGLGDSARLARRLAQSGNVLGWLATEVWDRFADRPFYCSQKALATVRDAADVVLYLVNAAEDAAAGGYVEHELRILRWMGRPVLVLLNQAGLARSAAAVAEDEARWTRRVADLVPAAEALTLDAFARCWVQEDRLIAAVGRVLPEARRAGLAPLRAAWRERNLGVFREATAVLGAALAATAADREDLAQRYDPAAFAARMKRWIASVRGAEPEDADARAAMGRLARRAAEREREALDRMIALHGLSGRARERVHALAAADFAVRRPADVAATGLVGGLVSGAMGGLAADLAVGGMSLGLGALVGGVLGALGAGGSAYAYNLAQGGDASAVQWDERFLATRAASLLLQYLAVAHFGRARGEWTEGTLPAEWAGLVEAALAPEAEALAALWTAVRSAGATKQAPEAGALLGRAARRALEALYPESAGVFAGQESA